MPTTVMASKIEDKGKVLTGEERYPVIGDLVPEETINEILGKLQGLDKYWHCIEKATEAKKVIGRGTVMLGSLFVISYGWKSSYGFGWNPPYEFHAWLWLPDEGIVDVALPGVVERGLATYDAIGPALTGRDPVIVAGTPPEWLQYSVMKEFCP